MPVLSRRSYGPVFPPRNGTRAQVAMVTGSDPAVGASALGGFVPVGRAEFGGGGGQVVPDGAGGQCCLPGDVLDRGAVGGEFQDVGFPAGERVVAGADGFGGELGVDVPPAGVNGTDDFGEDLPGDGLGQEPANPSGQRAFEVPRPAVAGDDQRGAVG